MIKKWRDKRAAKIRAARAQRFENGADNPTSRLKSGGEPENPSKGEL